jgi:hypothetical protein
MINLLNGNFTFCMNLLKSCTHVHHTMNPNLFIYNFIQTKQYILIYIYFNVKMTIKTSDIGGEND